MECVKETNLDDQDQTEQRSFCNLTREEHRRGDARMIGRLGSPQGARFRSELRARRRNFVFWRKLSKTRAPSSARYEFVGKCAGQDRGKETEGRNKLATRGCRQVSVDAG